MDKDQVAEILVEIGTLLELKGENPFKTRAYANAARILEGLSEPLDQLIAEDRLGEIKGIGEGLQKKITELATTGKLAYYDELRTSVPAGMRTMLTIPGLGPKKVKALYEKLGVETMEQLEAACKAGKVATLDGFGEKTQSKILEGIQFRDLRLAPLAERGARGRRTDPGKLARASRGDSLQRRGQRAAVQGGHWRH